MQRSGEIALDRLRSFFRTGNLFRFLIALILAFLLWAWVTSENDPEITRTIPEVQIALENAPPDLEIVGQVPTVEIRLQGPRSRIQFLETDSIQAVIDLSDISDPGTYTLPVEVQGIDKVRIREVTPDEVTIEVDRNVTAENIPVETVSPVDLPPNFKVDQISTNPSVVSISGPLENVSQVDSVRVDIAVNGRSSGFTDSLKPVAVDIDGRLVEGITIDPQQIEVTVNIEVRGQVRKVIPTVIGVDALAPGFELERPSTVVPSDEVIIDGPDEEVAKVLFLTTQPIDITGWDSSEIVRDVPLDLSNLPEGVTVDQETVHVSVQIRRETFRQEFTDIPIQVVNVRAGTTATLQPSTARVVLEGSRAVIETLVADDITVQVDLLASAPGTYQIQPRVILPAGVQYQDVEPSEVQVVISNSVTPAAPNSPTPTPAAGTE